MKYYIELSNGDIWETEFQVAGQIPDVGPLFWSRHFGENGTEFRQPGLPTPVLFGVYHTVAIYGEREATDGDD